MVDHAGYPWIGRGGHISMDDGWEISVKFSRDCFTEEKAL